MLGLLFSLCLAASPLQSSATTVQADTTVCQKQCPGNPRRINGRKHHRHHQCAADTTQCRQSGNPRRINGPKHRQCPRMEGDSTLQRRFGNPHRINGPKHPKCNGEGAKCDKMEKGCCGNCQKCEKKCDKKCGDK